MSLGLNFKNAKVPYTFHNDNSKSTIDHFLVTKNLNPYITKYESLFMVDDFSDHVPLKLELNININYFKEVPRSYVQSTAWEKCSLGQREEFVNTLNMLLLQINIHHEAITCKRVNCNIHNESIRKLHNDIIRLCLEADKVLPKTSSKPVNNNIVAGWNDYVREHKDMALYWHQLWLDNGRPPQGEIALNRRRTRAKYHYAIKFVKKEEIRIRSNKMAEAITTYENIHKYRQ